MPERVSKGPPPTTPTPETDEPGEAFTAPATHIWQCCRCGFEVRAGENEPKCPAGHPWMWLRNRDALRLARLSRATPEGPVPRG